jgi:hypothetical protein
LILRTVCFSLVGLCALAPQAAQDSAPPAHDGRGAVAILRRDGVMFPFAAFDRDRWRVPWPIGLMGMEIPILLDAVPERWWGTRTPHQWQAHLVGGGAVSVTPRAPVTFRAHCSRLLGIQTSYESALALPPVPVEPFPKDGVAVSGGVPLEPIERVAPSSPEWGALVGSLLKELNSLEDRTITGVRRSTMWRHPVGPEDRVKAPFRLESWYRSPSAEPGWTVSYIEAVRAYRPGPADNGCGLETLVSGWIHHENGVLRKASDLRARITYCDRVGATYMLPLGRIRPKDKTYWIFQLSGWEDEWYEVAEVGREKVRHVVEVYAGGRRGCR